MERKSTPDTKPLWRKHTQGTLYPFPKQRNRRVKFKETIEATEEELGNKRDEFDLVRDGTGVYKVSEHGKLSAAQREVAPPTTPSPDKDTYEVEEASKGWFNVVSSTGKVMNDKKLRQADAEELKASLEVPAPGDEQ